MNQIEPKSKSRSSSHDVGTTLTPMMRFNNVGLAAGTQLPTAGAYSFDFTVDVAPIILPTAVLIGAQPPPAAAPAPLFGVVTLKDATNLIYTVSFADLSSMAGCNTGSVVLNAMDSAGGSAEVIISVSFPPPVVPVPAVTLSSLGTDGTTLTLKFMLTNLSAADVLVTVDTGTPTSSTTIGKELKVTFPADPGSPQTVSVMVGGNTLSSFQFLQATPSNT